MEGKRSSAGYHKIKGSIDAGSALFVLSVWNQGSRVPTLIEDLLDVVDNA